MHTACCDAESVPWNTATLFRRLEKAAARVSAVPQLGAHERRPTRGKVPPRARLEGLPRQGHPVVWIGGIELGVVRLGFHRDEHGHDGPKFHLHRPAVRHARPLALNRVSASLGSTHVKRGAPRRQHVAPIARRSCAERHGEVLQVLAVPQSAHDHGVRVHESKHANQVHEVRRQLVHSPPVGVHIPWLGLAGHGGKPNAGVRGAPQPPHEVGLDLHVRRVRMEQILQPLAGCFVACGAVVVPNCNKIQRRAVAVGLYRSCLGAFAGCRQQEPVHTSVLLLLIVAVAVMRVKRRRHINLWRRCRQFDVHLYLVRGTIARCLYLQHKGPHGRP